MSATNEVQFWLDSAIIELLIYKLRIHRKLRPPRGIVAE